MHKLAFVLLFASLIVGCALPSQHYDPDTILVRFRQGVGDTGRNAALAPVNPGVVTALGLVPNVFEVEIGTSVEDAIDILQRNADVEDVEPNFYVVFDRFQNDPEFGQQWGHLNPTTGVDIGSTIGWNVTTGDPSFVVAVIDSGVRIAHGDLRGNLWINPADPANGVDDDGNGRVDDTYGWNFVDDNNDLTDPNDHGTRVAGILGMIGNNGIGGVGVLWECQLMVLKVADMGDVIHALHYALHRGVKVSNNSWSADPTATPAELDILYDNIEEAQQADHILVTSAGNSGLDIDAHPVYPGSFDLENIITVTALTQTGDKPYWSNFGATHVDIGAPGDHIFATSNSGGYVMTPAATSYAAPFVTGVVAAVMIHNPAWGWSDVRQKVLTSARPAIHLTGITVTEGCVSLRNALD